MVCELYYMETVFDVFVGEGEGTCLTPSPSGSHHQKLLYLLVSLPNSNIFHKKFKSGVPVGAQWLTNLTRNHDVAGSVPALVQWVNDPVLL